MRVVRDNSFCSSSGMPLTLLCVCVCMYAEDHDVHGCKSTVFTVSKFDIVSSDMERIVVNQFSNLEASHRKARSSSMSTLFFLSDKS